MIDEMRIKIKAAEPTPFHRMMGGLAKEGWLLRLYTQNVDGIDTDIPSLGKTEGGANKWPIAIPLHGRLDTLFCERCHNEQPFDRSLFENETATAQCEGCLKYPKRTRSGRTNAPAQPSLLRPRMLFYDDTIDLDGDLISKAIEFDKGQKVGTILVVGTSLSRDVPGSRNIVKALCDPDQGGHTIWINPQLPPKDLERYFGIIILAESDYVAKIWDPGFGTAIVQNTRQPVFAAQAISIPTEDATIPTITHPRASPKIPHKGPGPRERCPLCGAWQAYAVLSRHKQTCVTGECNDNKFHGICRWNYHLTICELGHPRQRQGPLTILYACKDCEETFNLTNFKAHIEKKHQGQRPNSEKTWTVAGRKARLLRKRGRVKKRCLR